MKINPLNYFHFKLIQLRLSFGFQTKLEDARDDAFISIVLTMNICVIGMLIYGKEIVERLFFIVIPIGIFSMLFYNKRRVRKIMEKYSEESEDSRLYGNAIVFLYVLISAVSFGWLITR